MRAAVYARVSSEEQVQGFSIAAQLRACRDYATAHGHTVAAEYVDEGLSAKSDDIRKRPQFQQMMADAAARRFDIVVVHKLDRFSRNLRLLLDCFSRLADANVELVSLSDKTAYRTPSDRLSVHVLASVAQWFSENLGAEIRKGKAERKRQGLYNGWLPFGATKGPDGVPIPDTRPLDNGSTNYAGLLLAFEMAAAGASTYEIAGRLNAGGWRTTGNYTGHIWTKRPVHWVLRNRFYIGELPGGVVGKHAPLVPADLFAEVQVALLRRSKSQVSIRRTATAYSLSGLLRCGECDSPIHIARARGIPRAFCAGRINTPTGCHQRSVALAVYEQQIGEWIAALRLDDASIVEAEAQRERPKPVGADKERQRLAGNLERLKELRLLGDIPLGEYLERRDTLKAELARLDVDGHQPRALRRFARDYGHLTANWPQLAAEQRRAMACALFERLEVRDGHITEVVVYPEFKGLLIT